MRLIHTGDWHLGRSLHGAALLEDQRAWLEELLRLAEAWRPHALLVAGDVYDWSLPPVEAMTLLDRTLRRLVLELGIAVVMIAGNHDSPGRLEFLSGLVAERGLHVRGTLRRPVAPVTLSDEHGPVDIFPVPYFDPIELRASAGGAEHPDPAAALFDELRAARRPGVRAVLLAHLFVSGATPSESERPLAAGGLEAIPAARLAGFDYVALGHLHRPQTVGHDRIRYAGSALKYAGGEADQAKSVTLIELEADGRCRIETRALPIRRDLRRLRGRLADLLQSAPADPRPDDYLFVELEDEGPLLEPMARLRSRWPNTLQVRRAEPPRDDAPGGPTVSPARRPPAELFAEFFQAATGGPLEADAAAVVAEELAALAREERTP